MPTLIIVILEEYSQKFILIQRGKILRNFSGHGREFNEASSSQFRY